jgi:hypothetical protein
MKGGSAIMDTTVLQLLVASLILAAIAVYFTVKLLELIEKKLGEVNTLTVHEGEKKLHGIPFYVKRGQLTHETSYIEKIATYTLSKIKVTLDDQNKPVKSEVKHCEVKTYSQWKDEAEEDKFKEMCKSINSAQKEQKDEHWENALKSFQELESYDGERPDRKLPLEKNVIEQSNFVDYEKIYYLNKNQPLIGSTDLEIELATDGTLTKTVGKTQDSTFEKLLELLPTDSLISQLESKPEIEKGDVTEKIIYEFTLTIEQMYVRHIYFRHVPTSKFAEPLTKDDKECWYRREIVTDLRKKTEENDTTPVGPTKKENEKNYSAATDPQEIEEEKTGTT